MFRREMHHIPFEARAEQGVLSAAARSGETLGLSPSRARSSAWSRGSELSLEGGTKNGAESAVDVTET